MGAPTSRAGIEPVFLGLPPDGSHPCRPGLTPKPAHIPSESHQPCAVPCWASFVGGDDESVGRAAPLALAYGSPALCCPWRRRTSFNTQTLDLLRPHDSPLAFSGEPISNPALPRPSWPAPSISHVGGEMSPRGRAACSARFADPATSPSACFSSTLRLLQSISLMLGPWVCAQGLCVVVLLEASASRGWSSVALKRRE